MSEQPTLFGDEPQRDPVADAERRRDEGMNRAAARRPDRVTLGRLAFISALLRSPSGSATLDDATAPDELSSKYADGGKWRGSVALSLAKDGLIAATGATRSRRRSRHRGLLSVWQLTDRGKAERYVRRMTAALAVYTNEATPSAATDGVATDTTKTNDHGDLSSDKPK